MTAANGVDGRQTGSGLQTPNHTLKPRLSGLTLWRPTIVLAGTVAVPPARATVLPGEPALRPEALQAQIAATRSALESLAEARELLAGEVAVSRTRAEAPATERARVAAVMETYRVKRTLDDALRATLRQVTALMEERGIR